MRSTDTVRIRKDLVMILSLNRLRESREKKGGTRIKASPNKTIGKTIAIVVMTPAISSLE